MLFADVLGCRSSRRGCSRGKGKRRWEVSLPHSGCWHPPRDELGQPPARWPLIRADVESFGSLGPPAPRQPAWGSLLTKSHLLSTSHPATPALPGLPLSPLLARAAPVKQSLPPPLLLINLEGKHKPTQEHHAAKPKPEPGCPPWSHPLRKHTACQKESAAIARLHALQLPPCFAVANPSPIKTYF